MSGGSRFVGKVLLGKLLVLRKIGGGGMGAVYEVEHQLTGHRRALKVVHPEYAEHSRHVRRLLREAKVAGRLQTPYVVETYDAGQLEDGSPYVLMELLQGVSMYELTSREVRLSPERLARFMIQVAQGVLTAHHANIIHRDLKPENIFVCSGQPERIKILDFGVSKFELPEEPSRLTGEGSLVGTPYYMSPEQAAGEEASPLSDIYAMGVIMYEALSGRLPFDGKSVSALFMKIGAGQAVPLNVRCPDLDPEFAELVHRSFDRNPQRRPQSARELREALRRYAGPIDDLWLGEPSAPPSVSTLPPSGESPLPAEPTLDESLTDRDTVSLRASVAPRQRPAWMWAGLGAAMVMLLSIPFYYWLGRSAGERPQPTATELPRVAPMPPAGEQRAEPVASPSNETEAREPSRIARPSQTAESLDTDVPQNEEPEPTRPRLRGSARAGLDPNPYR